MKGADEDQPVPKFLISCLLVIAVVSIKLSFSRLLQTLYIFSLLKLLLCSHGSRPLRDDFLLTW